MRPRLLPSFGVAPMLLAAVALVACSSQPASKVADTPDGASYAGSDAGPEGELAPEAGADAALLDGAAEAPGNIESRPLAQLEALSGSGALTPAFAPSIDAYSIEVGTATDFQVTAFATEPGAAVTVNDVPLSSGQPSPLLPFSPWLPLDARVQVSAPERAAHGYRVTPHGASRGPTALTLPDLPSSAGVSQFGTGLALDGDTLAVAAPIGPRGPASADGYAISGGHVYVYTRHGSAGPWSLQAVLSNTDAPTYDTADEIFGIRVALQGDTLVVNSSGNYGVARVFHRTGTAWALETTLRGPSAGDRFGQNLSIATYGDAIALADGRGAFVYRRRGTTWSQEAVLAPPVDAGAFSLGSVAMDGDRLAIFSAESTLGAVNTFVRTGNPSAPWAFEARVTPSDVTPGYLVSGVFALHGATLAMASYNQELGNLEAYVFTHQVGWHEARKIHRTELHFAAQSFTSLALSDDFLVIGIVGSEGTPGAVSLGARALDWGYLATLPSPTGASSWYGFATAISGLTLAVSDPFAGPPVTGDSFGAVFLYR